MSVNAIKQANPNHVLRAAFQQIRKGQDGWGGLIKALDVEAYGWDRLTWVEEQGSFVYGACGPGCVVWMSTALDNGCGVGIGLFEEGAWIEGYAGATTLILAELAWDDDVASALRQHLFEAQQGHSIVAHIDECGR